MKLNQNRRKAVAARLEVDRARQSKIADGVDRAAVGVACFCDGDNGRAELALHGLVVQRKGVAILVVVGAGLHDPRRVDRRHLGLGAHVIQHEEGHPLTGIGLGCGLALVESVNDEAAGVAVPRLVGLPLLRQEGRPRALDCTIGVVLGLAVLKDGLLPYEQDDLALGRNVFEIS